MSMWIGLGGGGGGGGTKVQAGQTDSSGFVALEGFDAPPFAIGFDFKLNQVVWPVSVTATEAQFPGGTLGTEFVLKERITGLVDPVAVAYDRTDGTIWVQELGAQPIKQFSGDGQTLLREINPPAAYTSGNALGLSIDPTDGTIWWTDQIGDVDLANAEVVHLDRDGTELAHFEVIGYSTPLDISADEDWLYCMMFGDTQVVQMTKAGVVQLFFTPNFGSDTRGVAVYQPAANVSDQHIFITDLNGRIQEVTAAGTFIRNIITPTGLTGIDYLPHVNHVLYASAGNDIIYELDLTAPQVDYIAVQAPSA